MALLAISFPVLDSNMDQFEEFLGELNGPRKAEFSASRARLACTSAHSCSVRPTAAWSSLRSRAPIRLARWQASALRRMRSRVGSGSGCWRSTRSAPPSPSPRWRCSSRCSVWPASRWARPSSDSTSNSPGLALLPVTATRAPCIKVAAFTPVASATLRSASSVEAGSKVASCPNASSSACRSDSGARRITADQNSTLVASTRSGLRAFSSASAACSSASATSKRVEPISRDVRRSTAAPGSSAR